MSIFLYSRVSHRSSKDSGISIDEQIRQGIEYASFNIPHDLFSSKNFGSSEPGVFADEAVSGWSKAVTTRPAGRYMDSLLTTGDHVICYSIDRLARNLRDFANTTYYWQQRGINIHYIVDQINTSTANGRLQANILAAMAQWSSDITSERVREANAIRRMLKGQEPCVGKQSKNIWLPSEYKVEDLPKTDRRSGTVWRYERVSSDSQYTSGLGLKYQSQANLNYAQRHAAKIGSEVGEAFVEDAVSAFKVKFQDRPEGKRLLSIVKPGDDIVIYRSDRAWRNPGDAVDMTKLLHDKGVYIHLVSEGLRTDTGNGLDWIGLFSSVAHLESSLKARKTRESIDYCRRNGRPIGTIPKGFKAVAVGKKKKLKLDINESAEAAAAVIMRHELQWSFNRVRDVLVAWRCRNKDVKCTQKQMVDISTVQRAIIQAEAIKKKVPTAVWNNILEKAWGLIRKPIEPKYWWVMDWEWPYNEEHAQAS